jgi:hypothetical protein
LQCGEIRVGKERLAGAAKPVHREKPGSEKRKETRSNPSVSYKKEGTGGWGRKNWRVPSDIARGKNVEVLRIERSRAKAR